MDEADEVERLAGRLLQEILRRTHLSAAADLPGILVEEALVVGVDPLAMYLIDDEQRLLVPLPGTAAEGREAIAVAGTLPGRVFAATTMIDVDDDGAGRRLWLPLVDGTERLGVAELTFAGRHDPVSGPLLALCERFGHLAATLITNKDLYSDVFKVLRRRAVPTSASELLRDLLPPLVHATDRFMLAALLEPCYDIGGDAYDYAINGELLHVAVFDAMGHGLAAAGSTAFALSVYRNSRRRGASLEETYASIDGAVALESPDSRFVTGLMAQLDVVSGRLRWINAGHPPPLLLRDGHLVKTLDLRPFPPMGLQLAQGAPTVGEESLEPGDVLLLYTDGLTEARRPNGERFSPDRLAAFVERQAADGHPAPETLRGLREAIIGTGEGVLSDDASALMVEWRRGGSLLPQTV